MNKIMKHKKKLKCTLYKTTHLEGTEGESSSRITFSISYRVCLAEFLKKFPFIYLALWIKDFILKSLVFLILTFPVKYSEIAYQDIFHFTKYFLS